MLELNYKKMSINNTLETLYKFYNKRLCELDDNGKKTHEQEYFAKYVAEFYNKNYETWSNSMKRIAEETNTIFWDTTFFNRQSFSCYFFLREDDKNKLNNRAKVLIMMSCLDKIYFIDDETNSKTDLVDLLTKEMRILHSTYFKVSEDELMISLKPYFECFKNVDFMDFTMYNALLGHKPSL